MAGVGLRPARGMVPARPLQADPGHPLSTGLVFFQFAGNEQGRVGGTGASIGQTGLGKGARFSNNASAFAVPIRQRWGSMHNWTMFTIVRCTSGADIYAALFEVPASPQNGSWVAPYHAFLISREFNTDDLNVGTNVSSSYTFATGTGTGLFAEDGLLHSFTCAWGTQQAIYYKDGIQVATAATTPNGTSATDPAVTGTPEMVYGGRSASAPGEGYIGDGVCQALWSRRLSAKEVADLHADPFEMFRDGR